MSQQTGRIHPAGLIDGVSPDVKHWFCGPDDPTDQGTHRHANPEHEVVEGVLVDVVKLVVELRSKVYQVTEVVVWIILQYTIEITNSTYRLRINAGRAYS